MLGLVDVEDADTPGLIALESDLAYHLIDLTLGGDPVQSPEPVARPFTAIDMALCRLHLDAILSAFAHAIGANLGRPLTKGLTIRDLRQNLSQLRLAPDYIDVMILGMDLALGEAGRRGRFRLILPLSALDVIRASVQAQNVQAARDRPNDLWKTLMRRAAASAPVRVDAVLHRQILTLAALQDLQVGQLIEIPRQSIEEIQLAIPQPGGRTAILATGRLGAYQDNKVIKLATPPDPRFVTHIDRALRAAPVQATVPAAARTGCRCAGCRRQPRHLSHSQPSSAASLWCRWNNPGQWRKLRSGGGDAMSDAAGHWEPETAGGPSIATLLDPVALEARLVEARARRARALAARGAPPALPHAVAAGRLLPFARAGLSSGYRHRGARRRTRRHRDPVARRRALDRRCCPDGRPARLPSHFERRPARSRSR